MFVGREQEITELYTHYSAMLEGHGGVFFLTGEAGLGKTTLVHEWRRHLNDWGSDGTDADPGLHPAFAEASCSIPIGGANVGVLEALQPWADILSQLQEEEQKAPKNRRLDFKRLLVETAPDWMFLVPVVGDMAYIVADTARAVREQLSGSKQQAPQSAGSQQQIFQQYSNLLTKISDRRPLVLFLDDMQWADTSSCNLLFHLARRIADKKILVVVTYRVEDAIAANDGKGHAILSVKNEILRYGVGTEFALSYFRRTVIRTLLVSLFSDYRPDDRFEHWLQTISGGNALFVTQFIQTLHEDGFITARGEFAGDYTAVAIPKTALAVIEERMRRLDDETRELLCLATVEGDEFTTHVLSRLSNKKPLELLRGLKRAEKSSFIREKGTSVMFGNTPTTVFGFSHALFHKALYDSLLEEERVIHHRACFELLRAEREKKEGAGNSRTSLAAKLITHAEKCGEYGVAAEVALDAAKTFWQDFSEHEALAMLEKVFSCSSRVSRDNHGETADGKWGDLLVPAYLLHGKIDNARARFGASLEWYAKALAAAREGGKQNMVIDALNGKAKVFTSSGNFTELLKQAEINLNEAEKVKYPKGIFEAIQLIGIAHSELSDQEKALDYFQRALEMSRAQEDHLQEANILASMAIVLMQLGEYSRAKTLYEQSLATCERLHARASMTFVLNSKGNMYRMMGEHAEAVKCFQRCLEVCSSIGDAVNEAAALANLGAAYSEFNDHQSASHSLLQGLRISREIGAKHIEMNLLSNLSALSFRLGDYSAALEWALLALDIAIRTNDFQGKDMLHATVGEIAKRFSQRQPSVEVFEQSFRAFRAKNAESAEKILDEIAGFAGNFGDKETATVLLKECLALCEPGNTAKYQQWQKELERIEAAVPK